MTTTLPLHTCCTHVMFTRYFFSTLITYKYYFVLAQSPDQAHWSQFLAESSEQIRMFLLECFISERKWSKFLLLSRVFVFDSYAEAHIILIPSLLNSHFRMPHTIIKSFYIRFSVPTNINIHLINSLPYFKILMACYTNLNFTYYLIVLASSHACRAHFVISC